MLLALYPCRWSKSCARTSSGRRTLRDMVAGISIGSASTSSLDTGGECSEGSPFLSVLADEGHFHVEKSLALRCIAMSSTS